MADLVSIFGLKSNVHEPKPTKDFKVDDSRQHTGDGTTIEQKNSLFDDLLARVPYRTWSLSDVAGLFFMITMAVE